MTDKDEFVENGNGLDEDLLDFEFDELLDGGLDEGGVEAASDEEVVELVDVVEEGVSIEHLESEEIVVSLEEDEALKEGPEEEETDLSAADPDSAEDLDLEVEMGDSDFEGLVEAEPEETPGVEAEMLVGEDDLTQEYSPEDIVTEPEEPEPSQHVDEDRAAPDELQAQMEAEVDDLTREFSSSDLEALMVETEEADLPEVPDTGSGTAMDGLESSEEGGVDHELDVLPETETPEERPEEAVREVKTEQLSVSDLQAETEASAGEVVSLGISEERLEAVIREVVESVVERVAREAMTSVAEKVIGEAIDDLKQGLISLSE